MQYQIITYFNSYNYCLISKKRHFYTHDSTVIHVTYVFWKQNLFFVKISDQQFFYFGSKMESKITQMLTYFSSQKLFRNVMNKLKLQSSFKMCRTREFQLERTEKNQ